jgi:hypothetical protein
MSEREVLFLLSGEDEVLWSDVGTAWALADSRLRWEAIWERRDVLGAVAHSHPGGPLAFSGTDRTTMSALDSALGRPLRYLVVAPEGTLASRAGVEERVWPEPAWAERLRVESGMERRTK